MKDSIIKNRDGNMKLKKRVTTCLIKAAAIFVWVLLWQFAYLYVKTELLIPSPIQVAKRLSSLIGTTEFWVIVFTSFFRIMKGYILGVIFGAIIAVLTSASKLIYSFLYPALSIIKATPVASFIILALVWLTSAKITAFMSFLMVLPIVWGNVHTAIKKVDNNLLQMAKIFHFGRVKTIFNIYIPSVMPYLVAACTTSLGLAWKAGIAAEVLAIPKSSIGRQIYNSKIYLETVDLFAWTIVIVIMSIIIEKLLVKLIDKFVKGAEV